MSLLELRNVLKELPGGFKIDNVSFSIDEKGIYGFFAKGKDGKTTLATILCGACDIDSGELLYKDKPMHAKAKQTAKIKKKIGYVPDACIFPADLTVSELLDFTGKAKGVDPDKRARQIKEALELTGLSENANSLIGTLSLCDKKCTAYANALIGNPDVIIIDEPMAVIDAAQRDEVKKLISMLGKMKVVLLFSKNSIDVEELCSHAGVLSDGALLAFEPIDELLSRLNKTVNAILRVRTKGVELSEIISSIETVEQVISIKALASSGAVSDLRLDCTTKEGVASAVSEVVEALGSEVVSLRFSTLALSDVIDALSAQNDRTESNLSKNEKEVD
jgi:ABC-2 type transport system ATP-binding protein